MTEEPYSEWAKRVYIESADKHGAAIGFVIWCLRNAHDVLDEYNEYDRQMRATGVFVKVEESE